MPNRLVRSALLLCLTALLMTPGCASRVYVGGAPSASATVRYRAPAPRVGVEVQQPQPQPPQTVPPGPSHRVTLMITADDAFSAFVDGQPVGGNTDWTHPQVIEVQVGPGEHTIAFYAEDMHSVISGFLGAVYVDGQLVARSGDGQFRAIANPPPGFEHPTYDDSNWPAAQICEDMQPWGNRPASIRQTGATWIWSGLCRRLGNSGFRLHLTL